MQDTESMQEDVIDKKSLYRMIPQVDRLLQDEQFSSMLKETNPSYIIESISLELNQVRESIRIGELHTEQLVIDRLTRLPNRICERAKKLGQYHMRRVINGTGILLHTNLGRAPFSENHIKKLTKLLQGYSNLEYNLEQGHRGERYAHFKDVICRITGAEDAIAVNNNAAAVLLVLSALCNEKEVVVSRGELIEIGGKFRIPDVVSQGGAILKEIGTTNKTHLEDYAAAMTEQTGAILKVHTSNYRIVGFMESVEVKELSRLAKNFQIPLIEDLGSGILLNLRKYGLEYEPTVKDSLEQGADLVCFSGDKLFGGPQAGIILGKEKYIRMLKQHPLMRALRIDKFTTAALEIICQEYELEEQAIKNIPVLSMLVQSVEEVEKRAEHLFQILQDVNYQCKLNIEDCMSQAGGGSLPAQEIKSKAVTFKPKDISINSMEKKLRFLELPILVRLAENKILVDLRTVSNDEVDLLASGIKKVLL